MGKTNKTEINLTAKRKLTIHPISECMKGLVKNHQLNSMPSYALNRRNYLPQPEMSISPASIYAATTHILLEDIPAPPSPPLPPPPPVITVSRSVQTQDVYILTTAQYNLIRFIKEFENMNVYRTNSVQEFKEEVTGFKQSKEENTEPANGEWVEEDTVFLVAESAEHVPEAEENEMTAPDYMEHYFDNIHDREAAVSHLLHQYQGISYLNEIPEVRPGQEFTTSAPAELNAMHLARRNTMPRRVPTARQRPPLSETPHEPYLRYGGRELRLVRH